MYLASVILICYIDTKMTIQRDWVCVGFCQYCPKNGSFLIFTRKQRDRLIRSIYLLRTLSVFVAELVLV